MGQLSIRMQDILAEQEQVKFEVMNSYSRELATVELALMALKESGGGAEAAAKLLLAMECGRGFDFSCLLSFDTSNRAKAQIVIEGYQPHDMWPSKWMDAIGKDGRATMKALRKKWG